MAESIQKVKKVFSLRRIIIPIFIGLFVSGLLLYNSFQEELFVKVADGTGSYSWIDINNNDFEEPNEFTLDANGSYNKKTTLELILSVNWGYQSFIWLFCALLTMLFRDLAYMYRLRVLSEKQLSWKSCFYSIMLWETSSAITPSVVGGSGIAMFILNREGISLGRSTAIVMITALLDELFFIVIVPLTILWLGTDALFPSYLDFKFFGQELDVFSIFLIGYSFIIFLTFTIMWGVFYSPVRLKKILFWLFSFKLLKKWRSNAIVTGNEIIVSSKVFKEKKISFWLKSFGATSFSWISRYFTANMVIMAFVAADDHILILGRQLVMWVIMLISPTPGGSGVAEALFMSLLKDSSISQLAIVAAIVWRFVSYYPYLFIGSFIFPSWLRRTSKKSLDTNKDN